MLPKVEQAGWMYSVIWMGRRHWACRNLRKQERKQAGPSAPSKAEMGHLPWVGPSDGPEGGTRVESVYL